ncbi:2-oxo-4-hydroxy-4-carboxy-5-ureidoimidazoline decarboxylase [Silvimonas terrae]|uniref:2-oxo-4-hydroxy-4-carboxy-5-ureidoimidazoline decarboxylase n=1 Tax=Silvimonas terrae TaxID=300266 RepID=A0A840RCW8_9NEIS|nr:2-oxo-4-hydroxy-4-carboxy-5-ureidoimidazoline decarboxylase [Silvimonas terrae]MBB5191319.1 2-oxo-4-hydroxy-4-carboxy-5-ureidoimidazoline decarboxylase [Silvimonas terrae]
MPIVYTLAGLSGLSQPDFVAALGDLYEHSPWVAQGAWAARPFASIDDLLAALSHTMRSATPAQQLALIRAHPELAGRAAVRGELTAHSTSEQHGAGLDQCSPQEFAQIQRLNSAWQHKFGFPFVIAVHGLDRAAIIARMEQRMTQDLPAEKAEALEQIDRIAALRLTRKLMPPD